MPHSTSSSSSTSHRKRPNAAASRMKRCSPTGDICSHCTAPLRMPMSRLCCASCADLALDSAVRTCARRRTNRVA
eukprot:1187700-Prorocentrum_minimum.AAC.5